MPGCASANITGGIQDTSTAAYSTDTSTNIQHWRLPVVPSDFTGTMPAIGNIR